MGELSKLPNIGKEIERKLAAVGITTQTQLRDVGSREALLRIRMQEDPGACLSMLCALEGAIRGVRWHDLDADVKAEMKGFVRGL